MVDIHCHILPGIDDGAENLEDSLEMARLAVESGTTVLAATPHCNTPGGPENYFGIQLEQRLNRFRQALAEEKIPLQVVLGAEAFGTDDLPDLVEQGRVATLNGSRYLLVEFGFEDDPERVRRVLEELLDCGVVPMVAHPERYGYLCRDPRLALEWKEMGCRLQINAGSIQGRFGRRIQDMALLLLEKGLADAVASDAHSPVRRTPYLRDVSEWLEDAYGAGCAQLLMTSRPVAMLQDLELED